MSTHVHNGRVQLAASAVIDPASVHLNWSAAC